MAEFSELALGDKVFINKHYYSSNCRYDPPHEALGSGLTGYVDGFRKKYDWTDRYHEVNVLVPCDPNATEYWVDHSRYLIEAHHLTILEKGTRQVIPGIDIHGSPCMWWHVEISEWEYRLQRVDQRHQGFCNFPTFLAWLYINNDCPALTAARRLRRKDGTINPNRLRDLFFDHKLTIDSEARELPLEIPEHLLKLGRWERYVPRVDWVEVAANI